MKTQDTTIGHATTKADAQRKADLWHNPSLGYHAQVVPHKELEGLYICRLVIND